MGMGFKPNALNLNQRILSSGRFARKFGLRQIFLLTETLFWPMQEATLNVHCY